MPSPSPARGRPLILHVEDSKTQLDVLKVVLERNGYSVLSAHTADEALQIVRETPVSLVIADHMFSGSGRSSLAGMIKLIKPTVPVVLHSGNPPASMDNLDGFIHKGEPTSALLSFIRDIVNHYWE